MRYHAADFVSDLTSLENGSERFLFQRSMIQIVGWPSGGGVIVLEDADALDLRHLQLSISQLDQKRYDDEAEEGRFCQRILQLGGIWWESPQRRTLIHQKLKAGPSPFPSGSLPHRRKNRSDVNYERDYLRIWPPSRPHEVTRLYVGWPSSGGLWVTEVVHHPIHGMNKQDFELMKQLGMLKLANSMVERCSLLEKHFRATFHESVDAYGGAGCLGWWKMRDDAPWSVKKDLQADISSKA